MKKSKFFALFGLTAILASLFRVKRNFNPEACSPYMDEKSRSEHS